MFDWDKIVNFGVPLLLLAWIAWFTSKSVWPFIVDRIKQSDQERRAFLATLEEMKINLRSNTDVTLQTLKEVRDLKISNEIERERAKDRDQSSEQRRQRG